ncbi:MAG: tRNA-intron lyase [Halobacteriales archaeon]|nr:tRNA-intron lyase [Halobacteriales archaeon]
MHGHRRDGTIVIGGDARQRFHDARGYGHPLEGNEIAVAPVEAAHLLFRGDLETVGGDDFPAFVETAATADPSFGPRFLVYADFRERGFYLSPAEPAWAEVIDAVESPDTAIDFYVYPRGQGPRDGDIAYRVRVLDEYTSVPIGTLDDDLLAIIDEEGEVTYLGASRPDYEGSAEYTPSAVSGTLLTDRVVVWDPPSDLYQSGFYGQPLDTGDSEQTPSGLHLSLVEATYLARNGWLTVEGGVDRLTARGQEIGDEAFDRRLQVYTALRDRSVVPKTGFKFGADFRTYADFESVDSLRHSERLVRVLPPDVTLSPRELALDVRLAHGVRKEIVFALADGETISWHSLQRVTP